MAYSSAGNAVSLPDFRNFGVLIRALVLTEAINGLALLAHSASVVDAWYRFGQWAPYFELILLLVLAALAGLQPVLSRLSYRSGAAAVLLLAVAIALAVAYGIAAWLARPAPDGLQVAVLTMSLTGALLVYFNWRHRALSPALGEARLAALEARIRPHFLFNSLNTVVALVREDSGLAERMLLDLSELFRVLLGEERGLVRLERELSLARAYGEIESIRLGGRLRLHWDAEGAPGACLVPLLILQPLLENALRHGVEPEPEGGEVWVEVAQRGAQLVMEVRNSLGPHAGGTGGNGMALANIRERLQLHFDAEAQIHTVERDGQFLARVELPARQGGRV
jgi:two-component system, LytTR family, sensor histidine kinase AlgZ